jgi:predicted RND superfamily exporter protein
LGLWAWRDRPEHGPSIIASVTIGIVVDDTIHIFWGQKREMERYNLPSKAIQHALIKVGAAMCVTSLLLVLGFGILTLSESKFIADFGLLSASAIAAALFADLFISPILLEKAKLFFVNEKHKDTEKLIETQFLGKDEI